MRATQTRARPLTAPLSKTQIDRLGDRLRAGPSTASDLRLLDEYRRSFRTAYDVVVGVIRDRLGLEATGRPAKSTGSIIEKLRRETIRLSQVQDIAGCRVVVGGVVEQSLAVMSLSDGFAGAEVVDRRANPSYGYRAVHVIVRESGKLVEVQVRTALQHLWAEMSEKFADVVNPDLKYGGGPDENRELLLRSSRTLAQVEDAKMRIAQLEGTLRGLPQEDVSEDARQELDRIREAVAQAEEQLAHIYGEVIASLARLKRKGR